MASPPSNPHRRERLFPAAYDKPDRSGFANPFNDRVILEYYRQLHYWHGFIRFLGIPKIKSEPDVLLDRLFVTPELSPRPLSPDEVSREDRSDDRTRLLDSVRTHPRLVVLGDPGSGKSTLVSWIAYQLSRSSKNPWVQALGPLLPLPMVVRDLKIDPDGGWDGLVKAFLDRPVAKDLDRGTVTAYLERGQALVALDGLDELTGVSVRRALRDAVHEGAGRYPGCRFLLTSRVVGYDQVPFHHSWRWENPDFITDRIDTQRSLSQHLVSTHGEEQSEPPSAADRGQWAEVAYVAPFSDSQIEDFVQRWYARHTEAEEEAERKAADLLKSVRSNPRTLRLARIPNLLTLMGLIHRILAHLARERVVLYGTIVDAYLESIDTFRGLSKADYSLDEKKRWLALVGFRMQQRRSEAMEERKPRQSEREILVSEGQVVEWLTETMARSPRPGDTADPGVTARAFVDYIARRSGLLLPRGEGRYAFTHLSMQEYFAALYLERRLTSPRWLRKGDAQDSFGPKELTALADEDAWREPLVLLFGLLAGRPDWAEELADLLFGEEFSLVRRAKPPEGAARARLLAEAAADPYSGLPGSLRQAGWEVCWEWELSLFCNVPEGVLLTTLNQVSRALFTVGSEEQSGVWNALLNAEARRESASIRLDLSGTGVTDVGPLSGLERLEQLGLSGTGVTDIGPLSGLERLAKLHLSGTGVTDIGSLSGLERLKWLYLSGTGVTGIGPLSGLERLVDLDLSGTGVTDVGPLSGLERLESLDLSGTGVTDVGPLGGLERLERLYLSGTGVTDIGPLSGLERLGWLDLSGTGVTDLAPLSGLERLEVLILSGTGVTDIGPLSDQEGLHIIGLSAPGD